MSVEKNDRRASAEGTETLSSHGVDDPRAYAATCHLPTSCLPFSLFSFSRTKVELMVENAFPQPEVDGILLKRALDCIALRSMVHAPVY